MAKARELSADDHVARYVKPTHRVLSEEGDVLEIFPDAFALRVDDNGTAERWLSSTWCEFFASEGLKAKAACALGAMEGAGFTAKKSGVVAILSVEKTKSSATNSGIRLRIVHDPAKSKHLNPAYAPIYGCRANASSSHLRAIFCEAGLVSTFSVSELAVLKQA